MTSLHALREQVHLIPSVEDHVSKVQAEIKQHVEDTRDDGILAHYLQLTRLFSDLCSHQQTTERLQSLVSGIGSLRGALVVDDMKNAMKIVQKHSADGRLSDLVQKARDFRGDIRKLKGFEDHLPQLILLRRELKNIQSQQYQLLKVGSVKFLELSQRALQ